MKKTITYFSLFIAILVIFSSFKSSDATFKNPPTEFELLVQYLEENGNFINSEFAPALIEASELKELLKNKNNLVLDIRSEAWFEYGYIKNAKNVKGPELLNYFKNDITPADYEKITIVCYSGQSASYYTSLLRLYGFDNVYSLKWGISSWDSELAARYWGKNSKDQLQESLETTPNTMPEKGNKPVLSTGKTEAKEILKTRIEEAFAKPYKEFIVKAPEAFADLTPYYIVNYVSKERYDFNHIKGAVNYEPKLLSTTGNLFTLPTDKKILVACDTGLSAAYVVAYLHVLGYEVGNLAYGANNYMNSTLVEKGWNGFSEKEIKDYTLVE